MDGYLSLLYFCCKLCSALWQVCIAKQFVFLWNCGEKEIFALSIDFEGTNDGHYLTPWIFNLSRFCKRKHFKNKRLFSYVFDNFCCIYYPQFYKQWVNKATLSFYNQDSNLSDHKQLEKPCTFKSCSEMLLFFWAAQIAQT